MNELIQGGFFVSFIILMFLEFKYIRKKDKRMLSKRIEVTYGIVLVITFFFSLTVLFIGFK